MPGRAAQRFTVKSRDTESPRCLPHDCAASGWRRRRAGHENGVDHARISPEQVDYINAHATSTDIGDLCETRAIKQIFGEYADKVSISATKSMTGHLLGGAGGIEMAACALAIRDSVIPPTINLENPGEECDLDYTPNVAREKKVRVDSIIPLGLAAITPPWSRARLKVSTRRGDLRLRRCNRFD
jgi:3-oxoacyl-(acyl-carrier-protein) synthase